MHAAFDRRSAEGPIFEDIADEEACMAVDTEQGGDAAVAEHTRVQSDDTQVSSTSSECVSTRVVESVPAQPAPAAATEPTIVLATGQPEYVSSLPVKAFPSPPPAEAPVQPSSAAVASASVWDNLPSDTVDPRVFADVARRAKGKGKGKQKGKKGKTAPAAMPPPPPPVPPPPPPAAASAHFPDIKAAIVKTTKPGLNMPREKKQKGVPTPPKPPPPPPAPPAVPSTKDADVDMSKYIASDPYRNAGMPSVPNLKMLTSIC